jgi:hypothetical protein
MQAMRKGGLMAPIAFSHVVVAGLLLFPRTRFVGGLLQLPMSLGMVAFHATMLPGGLVTAIPLLLFNVGVLADWARLRFRFERIPART